MEKKKKEFLFRSWRSLLFSSSVSFIFFLSLFISRAIIIPRLDARLLSSVRSSMRFLQPVTKIFFFPFLSNHRRDSFWKITYTMDEWEIAIKRDLPFFLPFEYTISRLSNTDTSPSRSSRKPHTPLTWAAATSLYQLLSRNKTVDCSLVSVLKFNFSFPFSPKRVTISSLFW